MALPNTSAGTPWKLRVGRGSELAAPYMERCFKELAKIAFPEPYPDGSTPRLSKDEDAVRISAMKLLLEYGLSKAPQLNEHAGVGGEPIAVTLKIVKDGVNGAPPETEK